MAHRGRVSLAWRHGRQILQHVDTAEQVMLSQGATPWVLKFDEEGFGFIARVGDASIWVDELFRVTVASKGGQLFVVVSGKSVALPDFQRRTTCDVFASVRLVPGACVQMEVLSFSSAMSVCHAL